MNGKHTIQGATALALGLSSLGAQAAANLDNHNTSLVPYTSSGYVGANLGVPQHHAPCALHSACKNPPLAGKIYTGGQLASGLGLELGYLHGGHMQRYGGRVTVQGINLSLVGNLPLHNNASAFLKVGGTYGWSNVSVSKPWPPQPAGKKRGGGLSYGAGLAFDLQRQHQLLLEWDRQSFRTVAGQHRVDLYSLGWKYRY